MSPDYLTQKEFAAELRKRGVQISEEWLRKLRYSGEIEFVRFGHRTIRIHQSEVERFIRRAQLAS